MARWQRATRHGHSAVQQAQIFGRFASMRNEGESRIEGTCPGLYLCREQVERQGERT
jgi:hypothetical protein